MKVPSRTLVAGVALCVGLFALILVLAYLVPASRELDAKALQGFLGLHRPTYWLTVNMSRLGDPAAVGVIGVVLAAFALLRGRQRLAFAVLVLLAATSVSSQVLKALLEYPRYLEPSDTAIVAPEAFPSGHATAAMALAIATVMVAPARARPLAALLGTALAVGVGLSVVAHGSHYPSDVAGGFLLAAGWGLLVALALGWAEARWPVRTLRGGVRVAVRRVTDVTATAGLAALVAGGLVLLIASGVAIALTRPGDVLDLARGHSAAVLVGSALLALAMGLLGGIALAIRRRG